MRNEPWNNQLDNRNYLSPVGFKFVITKAPKADFFSNSANIPGINLGFTEQPTYLKNIPVAGDKLTYCLLYTSPSPRDKRQSRMPSSA